MDAPVQAKRWQELATTTKHELIQHLEALYRRQDTLDLHESRMRLRAIQHTLPARELPVARRTDGVLMASDHAIILQHVIHVQTRIDEYLTVLTDIHRALDTTEKPKGGRPPVALTLSKEAAQERKERQEALKIARYERKRVSIMAMTPVEREEYLHKKRCASRQRTLQKVG